MTVFILDAFHICLGQFLKSCLLFPLYFLLLIKELDSSESRAKPFLSETEASARIPAEPGSRCDRGGGAEPAAEVRMLQVGDTTSFRGHPFCFRDAFKTTVGVVFCSFHTCVGPGSHLRSDWRTGGGPALIRTASELFTCGLGNS